MQLSPWGREETTKTQPPGLQRLAGQKITMYGRKGPAKSKTRISDTGMFPSCR